MKLSDVVEALYMANDTSTAFIGRGAFQHFKATVRHFGLEQEWYRYRDAQYKRVAIAWCEECGIELEAD